VGRCATPRHVEHERGEDVSAGLQARGEIEGFVEVVVDVAFAGPRPTSWPLQKNK